METSPAQTPAGAGPHTPDIPQDWGACLHMAGLLGQGDERTRAIAEVLFSVWQDVQRFESLDLDGVEPAVAFSAAWD